MTLAEVLADPVRRPVVVREAAALVDSEVASKSGLRGAALKAGFRAFTAIQPGIVAHAVDRLLPHFVPAIDPLWAQAMASGQPERWMTERSGQVADALLGVTDGLARNAKHALMVKIYGSLRGQARDHVIAAVPGLARLMMRHAG